MTNFVSIEDLMTNKFVNDDNHVGLSLSETIFYKEKVDNNLFAFYSVGKEKYLSSDGGNKITCTRDDRGDWEIFKTEERLGGTQQVILCNRNGFEDRWYQKNNEIFHYKSKAAGSGYNDRFLIKDAYTVKSEWRTLYDYRNEGSEDQEFDVEITEGTEVTNESTFSINIELQTEIETALVNSISNTFSVSSETSQTLTATQSKTVTTKYTFPAKTHRIIKQGVAFVTLKGEEITMEVYTNKYLDRIENLDD